MPFYGHFSDVKIEVEDVFADTKFVSSLAKQLINQNTEHKIDRLLIKEHTKRI